MENELSIMDQPAVLGLPRISFDSLAQETVSHLEVCLLQPRTILVCEKPLFFSHDDKLQPLSWMTAKSEFYTHPIYYLRILNGYVSPQWGAVFTADGKLIDDSIQAAKWADPTLSNIPGVSRTQNRYEFDEPKFTISGKYVLLNHWGSHNYGHFIIDCLIGIMPIMHLIKETNLKILCKPLAKWQRELMLLLGVPEESMIEAENDLYNVEDLIFPSFLGGNLDHPCNSTRMIFDLLRQRCSEFKETRASKRILIDRSDHPGRQVRNWAEVTATARDLGFEIIKTENMSVREQIELFANAQIVIGETGAAMTNIGFCDPGTHFIEIMIEGRESAWLKNTATVIGRRWSCMYCKTEKIGDRLLYDMDTDRLKQMVGCIL